MDEFEWKDTKFDIFSCWKACAVAKKRTWILKVLISSSISWKLSQQGKWLRGSFQDEKFKQGTKEFRWMLRAVNTHKTRNFQLRFQITRNQEALFILFCSLSTHFPFSVCLCLLQTILKRHFHRFLIFHRENSRHRHFFPTLLYHKRRLHKFNLTFICYSSIRYELLKNRQRKLFRQQNNPQRTSPRITVHLHVVRRELVIIK